MLGRPELFLIVLLIPFSVSAQDVTEWQVDSERSRLGFIATYDNIPFNAWFKQFTARIAFHPKALEKSRFIAEVDITSVDSDSRDRDEGMLQAEWFDTKTYPIARFVTTDFTARPGDSQFQALGRLSIKGTTQTVSLPFTWSSSPQAKAARLTGEMVLKRNDFHIGTGDWADDPTIGLQVKVLVDLHLNRP